MPPLGPNKEESRKLSVNITIRLNGSCLAGATVPEVCDLADAI